MRTPRIPQLPALRTVRLAEAAERYYYSAQCRQCGRDEAVDLHRARELLGDDFLLDNLRERLKCSACNKKDLVVCFMPKSSTWLPPSLARARDRTEPSPK